MVESGGNNIEVALLTPDNKLRILEDAEIEEYTKEIEAEKEANPPAQ